MKRVVTLLKDGQDGQTASSLPLCSLMMRIREKGRRNATHWLNWKCNWVFALPLILFPEGYPVSPELRCYLIEHGFEVGVHGLNHRGNPFKSREFFLNQVPKINHYLKEWGSVGFRAPSMYHSLEWVRDLEIEYDASTFDTDPFEPQSDGMQTIFPFWVQGNSDKKGYVELPYTLPQDFTVFVLMAEKGIDIWKNKLDWIVECGGMALLNVHPDYMNFDKKKTKMGEYPVKYYEQFLKYIIATYKNQYWHVLPKEIAWFWGKEFQTKKGDKKPL